MVLGLDVGVQVADQHGQNFGIRLALENVALVREELLEDGKVFDDAVMHQGDAAGVGGVRVGVAFGRRAVAGAQGKP